ncbi:hypothetical protein STBA_63480 [Streptomyces sp. MP131-18]|nr:hypothetical protein STBA_63480 [Streptomyces sp. MP131-18]
MLFHQVARHAAAERAGAAGDQHRAVRVKGAPGRGRGGHREHDLSDVPRLLEVAQRLGRPPHVPGGRGQRGEHARGGQVGAVTQQFPHPVGPGLDEVEGPVGGVLPRGAGPDVGLAHLDEPAAGREQLLPRVDEVARERVEHDVDAPAAGGVPERVGEVQGAGGRDVAFVEAERAQVAPLPGARGAEDLGAPVPGELHGGHADAAGRRVHEHRLARAQPGEVAQPVGRGEEGDRHGRGLHERPALRHVHEHPVIGHGQRPERAGQQAHHAVPGAERRDVVRDVEHDARALAAQLVAAVTAIAAGHHAQRQDDIAEVEPGGAYGDPHLPGAQRLGGLGGGTEPHVLHGAAGRRVAQAQPPGPGRVARRGERRLLAVEPGRVGDAGAQRQLRFAARHRGDRGRIRGRVAVRVQQGEPAGVFGLGGSQQAPGRRARQIGDRLALLHGDGPAGHENEPPVRMGVVRQPRAYPLRRVRDGGAHGARHVGRGTAAEVGEHRLLCRGVRHTRGGQ